jgi:3-deoxy-D-manno-octulosonate 8-phosphate phosphatase (KDO 8-P phosphatase)
VKDRQESLSGIKGIFSEIGGEFLLSPLQLKKKFINLKGIVFDWDGVFHTGQKGDGRSSAFSEVDSMGINMMRYGHWLENNQMLFTAIISGQNDSTAKKFALREHFNGIYTGILEKKKAIDHICDLMGFKPIEIGCVFDDIIDLPMAETCGLRILVRREANPLLLKYILENKLCDYITAFSAKDNALREISEMLLGLLGNYEMVVKSRVSFDKDYNQYWQVRNSIVTQPYVWHEGRIRRIDE